MWGSVLGCCSRRSNHFFVPRAVRRAVASAPQTSPANARCKHTKQQPARGMRDLLPDDAQRLRHVVDTVHRVARAFGFRETITPVVEHATLFQRTLGLDSDVVSKEMYTLGPDNDLCLRPENTAGVIRALLNVGQLGKPHRLVYSGPMFRYERPQKGRYREVHRHHGSCSQAALFCVLPIFHWLACFFHLPCPSFGRLAQNTLVLTRYKVTRK
eukprot:m.190789 g.190789  ORF g.190789 m.190789 type:complete len:213 (+) comp18239_c0_seq4:135-773(+)